MDKIRVVIKNPKESAIIKQVLPDIKCFEGIVKGAIATEYADDFSELHGILLVSNQNSEAKHLEPNIYYDYRTSIIEGNCLFVKTAQSGEFVSMSDEEVAHITDFCESNEFLLLDFLRGKMV